VRILVEAFHLRPKRSKPIMKFYEYRYTKSELLGFVKEAGFKVIELLPKDDLAPDKSIALWLDYPRFRNKNNKIFELNSQGKLFKSILNAITPFTYSALIVAVCRKP
jgi:hypothetical protein